VLLLLGGNITHFGWWIARRELDGGVTLVAGDEILVKTRQLVLKDGWYVNSYPTLGTS
jgi:hypothetical protein